MTADGALEHRQLLREIAKYLIKDCRVRVLLDPVKQK